MKKLLLALALCSVAIPSFGDHLFVVKKHLIMHSHAERIISRGITLQESFDTNKRIAYFVKLCDHSLNAGFGTGGGCDLPDRKDDTKNNLDGVWFCFLDDEGLSTCNRKY